jgi:hypothetical protein
MKKKNIILQTNYSIRGKEKVYKIIAQAVHLRCPDSSCTVDLPTLKANNAQLVLRCNVYWSNLIG